MIPIIILTFIIVLFIEIFQHKIKTISSRSEAVEAILKKYFKIVICILLLVVGSLVWFDQSRTFYCLSDGRCVTVWKRVGNICYIIPGRYYCIFKPDDNYIQTNNKQYLTLYFSNNIPNKIIVRNQGNASGGKGEYKIINNRKEKLQFFAYSDIYKAILYKPNAVKFIDVKPNTEYIDLVIDENYAIDKTGRILE